MGAKNTYPLDDGCFDLRVQSIDLANDILRCRLVGEVVDGNVGTLGCELFRDCSAQAAVSPFIKSVQSAIKDEGPTYREPPATRTLRFFREYPMMVSSNCYL